MNLPRGTEIILILLVVLLLFGAKRLPDAARGLGRSLRIFKAETKGLRDEEQDAKSEGDAEAPAISANKPVTAEAVREDQPEQPRQQ